MHKALNFHTPHLAAIKLPRPTLPLHSTRVALHRQEQVIVPFSRTEHHLRFFLPRYGRLWNQLAHQTDLHHHAYLHKLRGPRPLPTSTPPVLPSLSSQIGFWELHLNILNEGVFYPLVRSSLLLSYLREIAVELIQQL
ncbi:hypothetical protein GWK47_000644 [Chionoecetes opilio]|uniref:Uncharacterized protein n=1 Tax=Chionoecetes opilio TaxID=41210 RepID=A0A8J4Y507_CHIOP|nr:hypothetical protein GWK47_000644 [Chionoecetes opilio]